MPKSLIFVCTLITGFSAAGQNPHAHKCHSVDRTLRLARNGNATAEDILRAMLCQLQTQSYLKEVSCETETGIYKDFKYFMEARFTAGEVRRGLVAAAQQKANEAEQACQEKRRKKSAQH